MLVTMNRDERWTRAAEHPPTIHAARSGRPAWMAPADGERGGTWIGANDAGVVACLLNGYAPGDLDLFVRPDVPSRGEIIPALLGCRPEAVTEWIRDGLGAPRYPSFTLLVLLPDDAMIVRWRLDSGLEIETVDDSWSHITSSFWRADEVVAWRGEQFAQWIAGGASSTAGVPDYNLLEVADRREWSVFMTRSFSATRSITQVGLNGDLDRLEMRFWARTGAEPVNPSLPAAELSLPLAHSSAGGENG